MKKIILILVCWPHFTTAFSQEKNETAKASISKTYTLPQLDIEAANNKYGFSPDSPVRVGKGPNGGPANQRAYLELLRDVQGNPVQYERKGSCCDYETPNGFMGWGRLDKYEITYRNEKGKKKTAIVYISFYDYESPMVLHGFKAANKERPASSL